MKKYLIIFCICLSVIVSGCDNEKSVDGNPKLEKDNSLVTSDEAKDKINNGAVLIDVRTKSEYNENHIDGALLLPVDNIAEEEVLELASDKDTVLIVYCASGNRSARAVTILKDLGYTNVYDLGSINNWEE